MACCLNDYFYEWENGIVILRREAPKNLLFYPECSGEVIDSSLRSE